MKRLTINRFALLFLLICGSLSTSAQGIIYQTLNAKLTDKQSTHVDVLVPVEEEMSQSKYASNIDPNLLLEANFFNPNLTAINALKSNDLDLITISLDLPDIGLSDIGLYRKNIFTEDLVIDSDEGVLSNKDAKKILFYRGVVLNYPNSLVSITISGDEVSGMISIGNNNYNLGKIKGMSTHILYHEKDLNLAHDFVCGAVEDEIGDAKPIGNFNPDKTTQCVRIRVEVDNGLTSQLGGLVGATNYVASLYNEVITLYANDNISVNVSEVFIWQNSSPYSGDSGQILNQMNNTSSNSDITTLLSSQGSGGVAWLSGLCSTSNATNFNSINGFHSNVPTYSWDVEVVSHEMGHNLSSPHTHACAWNGNNTAIDGCGPDAGYSEGCTGTLPAGGGTIMSYCHLTAVGIDFTMGFGPQPSQRIRDYVDGSGCLGTVCAAAQPTCDDGILNGTETGIDCGNAQCGPCPTCIDGIQNGNETGIDCGGADCTPCPCADAGIILTLNFDNYPEETSWELANDLGAIVASGGTYPNEADGSTLSIPMCVPGGCYDLTILDSFGDGMCCSVGTGSYDLSDYAGNSLVSGGDFTNSETTNICLVDQNTMATLNLKAFLEGPYVNASELMNDLLRSNGELPLTEPYSAMGYSVPSTSTSIGVLGQTGNDAIVDWVLVELRSGADPTSSIGMQAALIQRDGDIVSVDGISPVSMDIGSETNVYVVLRHRNHFGIRTANSYPIGGTINVEFSNPSTALFGSGSVILVGANNVLISGDANSDGQINSIDKNIFWRVQNGIGFDYATFRSDFNLDGAVNSVDKNFFWRINNSKAQQLD
ncbi:MAG: hypothetical protein ACI8XB_002487 [Patiriisocius sp.]|jgi:hypothetical protein